MLWSNLSIEETYRMYGKVSKAQLDQMIEDRAQAPDLDAVETKIEEGMTQFPAEDFLEGFKNRLIALSKCMNKSANKTELLACIEQLDDIAQCTFYAADYGRSELNDALSEVKKALGR